MAEKTITEICEDFPDTRYFLDAQGRINFGLPIPDHPEMHFRVDDTGKILFDFPEDVYKAVWDAYIEKELEKQAETDPEIRKYRTKKMAGNTALIPSVMATPSTPNWKTAITVMEGKKPHVVPIQQSVKIDFQNGQFRYNGVDLTQLDLNDVRDTEITKLDLPTLRVLYSVILQDLVSSFNDGVLTEDNVVNHKITIRIPELMKEMGMQPNANRQHVNALVDKIRSYQSMIGVMYKPAGRGKYYEDKYAVLVWIAHEESNNTITFEAPYLNILAYRIMDSSIRRDSRGTIQRKKNGQPKLSASHSYLIMTSIASEKNKQAVEVVQIICDLIENAGSHPGTIPHISVKTILKQHPQLQQALDQIEDQSNKTRLLRTTFKRAWELLHEKTWLELYYPGIKFPSVTPTITTLDMVFEFPHNGKVKGITEQDKQNFLANRNAT